MKFTEFFKNVAMAAMTAIALYVANKIDSMSLSIAQLNTNVAIVIQQVSSATIRIDDHEARLRAVEKQN